MFKVSKVLKKFWHTSFKTNAFSFWKWTNYKRIYLQFFNQSKTWVWDQRKKLYLWKTVKLCLNAKLVQKPNFFKSNALFLETNAVWIHNLKTSRLILLKNHTWMYSNLKTALTFKVSQILKKVWHTSFKTNAFSFWKWTNYKRICF